MTEGLEEKDLELKGLFMKQELERTVELLDSMPVQEVLEMIEVNRNIVQKYYDLGRADLLRKHLSFVAYTSFITEYAQKAGLYEEAEFKEKSLIFEQIIQLLQADAMENN